MYLENIFNVSWTIITAISFAMQQNNIPMIRRLIVTNTSDRDFKNLTLKITSEPKFADELCLTLDSLECGGMAELSPVQLNLNADYLYALTERTSGMIMLSISCGDDVLYSESRPVELLSYNEWPGLCVMPELISSYVVPDHPAVLSILRGASDYLKKWSDNGESVGFIGYMSKNPNTVKLQMAAIYAALSSLDITYCLPSADFENSGQKIRLADNILTDRIANCIDLTLLYAACLEAAKLHPIIIFTHGHAFCGCWLEDSTFSECVQDDISVITKRTVPGIDEIFLIECKSMTTGGNDFNESGKLANKQLESMSDFVLAVDVMRSRSAGIRPLPMYLPNEADSISLSDNTQVSKPDLIEHSSISSPMEDTSYPLKQRMWERKLLDLSLRNTLLSFRLTKNALQLMCNDLVFIEDSLAGGESFKILPKPQNWEGSTKGEKFYIKANMSDADKTLADEEIKNHRIRTYLNEHDLEVSIKNIHRQAKISIEENGANTLYLALGFLRWYESNVSERARFAPIILVPVELIRRVQTREYILRPRDEESRINVTLLEMLRQDFGISIDGLDPLPTDASGVDINKVFNIIRKAVMEQRRWDIEEISFLGLFSFNQFIMWNDIHCRSNELSQNKVVKSLIDGKMEWQPVENLLSAHELDEKLPPSAMAVPMSADASQMTAIYAASAGQSFVLHGPPGTGKSQTITNMIANALYQGKSVLFVAEKMAALTVVQKRLASIGLDPFCLELHSNKARKKDVLDQLEKTLDVGRIKSPEEYENAADRLHDMRNELNSFVWQLHMNRNYGMSLYDTITLYEKNLEHDGKLTLSSNKKFIGKLKNNSFSNFRTLISKFRIAASECGADLSSHPLKMFGSRDYTFGIQNELSTEINKLKDLVQKLDCVLAEISSLFALSSDGSLGDIEKFRNLAETFLNCGHFSASLLINPEAVLLKNKIYHAAEIIGEKNDLDAEILKNFTANVFSYDASSALLRWKTAEQSWVLKKSLDKRKLLKELRIYAQSPDLITDDSIEDFYEKLISRASLTSEIDSLGSSMTALLGAMWDGASTDPELICDVYDSTMELRSAVLSMANDNNEVYNALRSIANIGEGKKAFISGFISCVSDTFAHIDHLSSRYKINIKATEASTYWCPYIIGIADMWLNALPRLKEWTSYLRICDELQNAGLSNVITALESGSISCEDMIPAFDCAFAKECAMYTISESADLRNFQGSQFNDTIRRYGDTITKFEKLTIYELVAKLSAKIPVAGVNNANSSEIGVLRRAIKSGGRMMSIRKLFDSIPSLLRRLCPCMLMSPISVAQYIDPSYPKFDLVIFDEASQLPTSEAVGAIARGENAIIVGDPKQLPPTTFFAGTHVDDDNVDLQDLESLLDDCLALSMPQEHLKWHYRSRHESLIAYSNMHYYDNKLYTFPSPNDMESMVKLVHVDGVYDRGGTKQNQAEAEAVVAEIVRRYKDANLRNDSIGVVTFNSVQQNLIDDLLMEAFREDPELEDINNLHREPLFIKNLENVQGDERDVILFSVGYGPDKTGKVTLNFGPLNREGGWRRLNVAISRARKEMVVYSTLRPEDIDLSKTTAAGAAGLRGFLEFAQRGKNTVVGNSSTYEHGLEELIAEKLMECGFKVRCGVGCSEYKIDIGIVDDEEPSKYILGIICDGKIYNNGDTARDRNILQPSILTSLGWKLWRVWSLDWLDNPERELDKILTAVKLAKREKNMPFLREKELISQKMGDSLRFEKQDEAEIQSKYKRVYMSAQRDHDPALGDFYAPESERAIKKYIDYIIHVESPISKDLLCRRVADAWGIARIGPRVEEIIDKLLKKVKADEMDVNGTIFLWSYDLAPAGYEEYRVPETDEDKRSMNDICPIEISNAVRDILLAQISMSQEDLVREVAKVFGYARPGSQIEQVVNAGISSACSRGFASIGSDGKVSLKE